MDDDDLVARIAAGDAAATVRGARESAGD
jgi:hypothetical protein